MKFKLKILYNNKVEPTTKLETDDPDELKDQVSKIIDEIMDDSSKITGLFLSKS